MNPWLALVIAGLMEVAFTTCLKLSEGFTRPLYTALFIACSAASFGLLSVAAQTIPLGTAYAVWTGLGAAGTAVVGIVWFGEGADTIRLVLLMVLVGAVIGLKVYGD